MFVKPRSAFVGKPSVVASSSGSAKYARYARLFPSTRKSSLSRAGASSRSSSRPVSVFGDIDPSVRRGGNNPAACLVGRCMGRNRTALGATFATATALAWGGQFVVGKSALGSVNAFPLTTVRYALAAALWLVALSPLEGRRSFRLGGRGLRLFWLGSLGFAGFNLLAYTGLAHA